MASSIKKMELFNVRSGTNRRSIMSRVASDFMFDLAYRLYIVEDHLTMIYETCHESGPLGTS